ncbi:uncharacterized protein [Diadema antillarum]|uniref:uncharacterized protein n=1 Tax=Diadema antillarum TaxID=105358 RepID=UPI003A8626FA
MPSSEHDIADTNKPDSLTGTNVSIVAAVVEPLRPVAKPRNFSQISAEGKQQNDGGGLDMVSDANCQPGGHHVYSGDVPQDSNAGKPPVPRPRMARISSEPELGVGGSGGKVAKLTKQLSADQQPGLYRKRKAPKRPPPIQDNAALSALQSAFLQALSQQSKNASANKVSTAPAMKLRPSRPPPLPPSFRKERSSSTTESRLKQAPPKHLAPRSASESELKLATAGSIAPTQQPGKGHGGVGKDTRPAVPPRRKKKSSSDMDGKGHLQDVKSDASKNKLPSSETLKDSQAAGRSAVPPVPAARMRKQKSADAKIDAVRPVPKKSNQIQVRAEIVAPPTRLQGEQDTLPPVDGNIMAAQNSSGSIIPMQKTSSVAREASTKSGSVPSDTNPSSENLEDVLRRRLRGLHRSVRLEESFDASTSNDDVFLDDSFGDASSGPNARSSDHLSSTHDSTDVQPLAASGQPPQEAVEGATAKRVPSGLQGGEPEPVVVVDSVTSPTSVSPVLPEKVKGQPTLVIVTLLFTPQNSLSPLCRPDPPQKDTSRPLHTFFPYETVSHIVERQTSCMNPNAVISNDEVKNMSMNSVACSE